MITACRPFFSISRLYYFSLLPNLATGILFCIFLRHLCAIYFFMSTLATSFCGPSRAVSVCFAYPSTYLIFSHVMLSAHFMFFLRGLLPLPYTIFSRCPAWLACLAPSADFLPFFTHPYPAIILDACSFLSRGYYTILYLALTSLQKFLHLCFFLPSVASPPFSLTALTTPDFLPSTFLNFDVDTYDVAFDNCTSYCVTNDKLDFIFNDFIPATPASIPIHGVGGPSSPLGFGTVLWRFRDDSNVLHSFRIPNVAYLPACPIRLCRPQALSRDVFGDIDDNGTFITTYGTHSLLVFNFRQFERTIIHPPRSGIPILACGPGLTTFRQFFEGPFTAIYGASLDPSRPSPSAPAPLLDPFSHQLPALVHPVAPLSSAQLELLRLPLRLVGHMNLSVIQNMIKSGQLLTSIRDASTCPLPKCAACLYGKMKRKPWRTKKPPGSVIDSLMSMPFLMPDGPLRPSRSASIDQFSCSELGLVGHSKGILTLKSFRGGAVFVDTESMVSYVHLQTSLNAAQTLAGKLAFEREMAKYGRAIVTYRADNGIFADNAFKAIIDASNQSITYCGVGGHHQNSLAENRIGILCQNARSMLLHATLLWPEAVTSALWPFAMCLSNDLCNLQPRSDGPC